MIGDEASIFQMINGPIHQEETVILSILHLVTGQKLKKKEMDKFTTTVRYANNSFSVTAKTTRQKISKDKEDLSNTTSHPVSNE